MKLQQAIDQAQAQATHEPMFVVYDPGPDHEQNYMVANAAEESKHYRDCEVIFIAHPPAKPDYTPQAQTCTPVLPGFEDVYRPAWQAKHGGTADLTGLPMFNTKG